YLVVGGGLACAVSVAALIAAPTAAPLLSVACLGLGLGAVLSLGITFMSMRAAHHGSAGQLSAMSQCVGYLVAAAGPALFGAAKDATGSWTLGLVAVLIAIIPMTVSGYLCGRGGHV
ncbi:MAG: CynX/NimT family MFS transporter, partial [Myxococcota bacterium]